MREPPFFGQLFFIFKLLIMAYSLDWVPAPIADFKVFADTFCSEVATNKTAWGLDATDAAAIVGEHTTFNDDYALSSVKNNHTALQTQATQDARAPLEARIRKMGIPMKTNSLMTDVNRTACGVHNDSDLHTLSPVADSAPPVLYERAGDLGGNMAFGIPTGGEPAGQDGISVTFGFYAIGATPPKEADCTQTIMYKTKHGHVVFSDTHFGMAFVAFARYYNTRAILGTVATKFGGIVS